MKTLSQRIPPFIHALLSLGLLLILPAALSAGLAQAPEIGGLWTVSSICTIEGENVACEFEGSGQVSQDGSQLMGTVQLMRVAGPDSCPAEMTAVLSGIVEGNNFFGTLDGGQLLGVLDFNGTVSPDARTIVGTFQVQDGGPFQGKTGDWSSERLVSNITIPTLSGVALVLLLVLLLGSGLILLRRRATVA